MSRRNVCFSRSPSRGAVRLKVSLALCVAVITATTLLVGADDPSETSNAKAPAIHAEVFVQLSESYARDTLPLVKTFCLDCHSAETKEGEFDLERFATLDAVRRDPAAWQRVAEMLDNGEMPPKDADQPTADQRKALREWVGEYLDAEARADAGDPGRVVLRRLSNVEYTYTLRDLTGVESLDPAREFPVDGAAGEGFTNTGSALVMSPALITKYLDAGKRVAERAMLLPDGIRFSKNTTRRDRTNEILADIKAFYRPYTDASGATRVNLQGLVWDTNEGGLLPLDKFLAATIVDRDALLSGKTSIDAVATERGVNAKYLGILWRTLTAEDRSPLVEPIRAMWRTAKVEDVPAIVTEIGRWQQPLWKFSSVGHVGKVGGPKAWMEPVDPIVARQDVRLKLAPTADANGDAVFYLSATPVFSHDVARNENSASVVWQQPRLVAPGKVDVPLAEVRAISEAWLARRERMFAATAKSLAVAAEVRAAAKNANVAELAKRHEVDAESLAAWLEFLGLDSAGEVKIDSLLTKRTRGAAGHDFIAGWTNGDLPSVVANSSDQHVRIPGHMKAHGFAVHPSPKLNVATGWRSPVAAKVRIDGTIVHAHPECGNGVVWSLEHRRGSIRRKLAEGVAQGPATMKVGPIESLAVLPGDFVSLVVGPRDGNHSCDLTAVDLVLTDTDDAKRTWNLAADVSSDILAGNPHADRLGNDRVWHFYTEPVANSAAVGPALPQGSVLAQWFAAAGADAQKPLAGATAKLLADGPPADEKHPDAALYRQLASFAGPLLRTAREDAAKARAGGNATDAATARYGVDPARFGNGANLTMAAAETVEIRLPRVFAEGWELAASAVLDAAQGRSASVQIQTTTAKPEISSAPRPDLPILVAESGASRDEAFAALSAFRKVFPPAICYMKIVPVDEVVTLTLFYREDDHLRRLMLSDGEAAKLDRMWDELRYVSQDALTLVDAFLQLMEYATQDADPSVFEPLRKPIHDRAAAYRQRLLDTEPRHVDGVLRFAELAYRRPLADGEAAELRSLYAKLRTEDVAHEEAIRLVLARVFVSPAFLYKVETPPEGTASGPVSDWELASRLSYFLWSSAPDGELRKIAASGKLRDENVLRAQTRRMLRDPKIRRLATEFACQWLHIRDVAELDEKSERHFPTFVAVRGAMQEEATLFFADFFSRGGSVLEILDSDHTFLNESLAKHYGIDGVVGETWQRVDGMKSRGRGGVLAQAATLSKQSGASRTSPILRGTWISEVLLGERMPRPPKDVPLLPEDEAATAELTVRQLVERHSSDAKCAVCHKRFDHYGFALENFDAIGRDREKDLGDRPIDARAATPEGFEMNGVAGLRDYLLSQRREAFLRQFCRKLLGYALGRAVQLSDEPLLSEMQSELAAKNYDVALAVEKIVTSRQFREIRGRDAAVEADAH
jgi:hypothetical protein